MRLNLMQRLMAITGLGHDHHPWQVLQQRVKAGAYQRMILGQQNA